MKEGDRGPFFPKLRVRIKDNNTSLHGHEIQMFDKAPP